MEMSLQQDEVFQDLYEKKARPKKKRSTDMMVTMNLNEKFSNMSQEQKQKFKDFAVNLFDHKKILDYFENKGSPENPLRDMDWVEVKWKPEVGPVSGKLHLHALVAIEHHGFLTFKANKLREDAKKLFGHNVYLNCPVSSNERVRWYNYLTKGFIELDK